MKRKIILGLSLIFILSTVQAFEGGSGTSGDPYQIANCQHLQDMQDDVGAHYELVGNIDCSGTKFDPVGNNETGFTGSLDGQHNIIWNLEIDGAVDENVGLIARNEGTLKNVKIQGAEVYGENKNGGILAAENVGGVINRSMVTGIIDVPSSTVDGGYGTRVGGMVGTTRSGGIITESYAVAYVDSQVQGGLAGALTDSSTEIRRSYAAGQVTTDGYPAGGGGMVGDVIDGSVRESYGASYLVNPDPDSSDGGLAGVQRFGGSVTDGYYNQNVSGLDGDDGNSSIGGTANPGTNLTTRMMTDTSNSDMSGFDFTTTWESTSFYYPKLSWQEVGSGTSGDPYMIEDCRQLQAMQNDLNAHYRLANDIDCSLTEYWNDGKGFDPVGDSSSRFNGVLNGAGHVIYNLTINRSGTSEEVGLFGYMTSNADINRVRKLGLENVDITGETDVGGIIGQNDHNRETIRKSYVTGNISGNTPVGALIGTNFGQVIDSYAHANVSGYSVGGLIGSDYVDPLVRTYFTGSSTGRPVVDYEDTDNGVNATNTYWDIDTTGIQSNPDGHGAEPLRKYEMTDRRAVEYMEGFNFTDTWVARDNDRYPELAVFTNESGFSPGVDQPPGLPTLLSPDDNQEIVPIDPNLTAELYHPQDESMTVDFVRSDGSNIGSDSGGSLDSVYSIWNGRDSGTSYNWSLIIEDSSGQSLNVTEWIEDWSFTTIYAPDRPGTPDPSDGEAGVEVDSNLTAFTSQNDGLNLFSDLYLTNNSSDARSEFDLEASSSVSGSGDAEFDPSELDNSTDYSWFVNSTVTDSNGNILWNAGPTWNFRSYEAPEPGEIMPKDGETGLDSQPQLNVSVDHSENLTVDFYDFQSNTLLGTERIENGNWANISTDSFNEYSKSQTHYWYVDITTDSGERWNNNDSQAYSFTVSNVEDVNFDEKTENDINLDPGTADVGQEELRAEVSTPNDVTMEEIAFNISNSTDYEVTGNSYDVASGETVTANLSEASIVQEDGNYDWYAFYREGSNVLFNSSERTFSTYVAQIDWVPTAGNYEGGDRETINIYYSESSTGFENFDYSDSIDYSRIENNGITVANPRVDSGDEACYNLTVENLLGESSPKGDCIGGIP